MDNNEIVKLNTVAKRYSQSESFVLKNISLTLKEKSFVFICGPSGVGKSTLLHIIGLMDTPTCGEVFFLNHKIDYKDTNMLSKMRITNIGFMFQYHYLLETLTVKENILLPYWMKKGVVDKKINPYSQEGKFIYEYIKILGIEHLLDRYPYELSGGEQQRVALARALVNKPKLLIADEPTGNLDHTNAINIVTLLKNFIELFGMTVLVATHNIELTKYGDVVIYLSDGEIKEIITK